MLKGNLTMHRLNLVLTAAMFAVGLTTSHAFATDLTITSFGGPIADKQKEAFYDPFQKATGIGYKVNEYNGEFAKIRSMVETNNVVWDVVHVEHPELVRGCDEGLFVQIDINKVGGEGRFIPGSVEPCGVPHIVWSMIYAYDADKITGKAPASWADFWDVKTYPGKRALRQSAKPTIEAALLADGVPLENVYDVLRTEEGVNRAFKKLDELKPSVIWWKAGAQPMQLLAAGDVAMTSAYNGRVSLAKADGKNFNIVWNGQAYDIDYWTIVSGSPNVDAAYKFLDFASGAEQGALYAAIANYGAPTVDGAAASQNPDLPTNPDHLKEGLQIDTEFWVENGERLEQRFQAWVGQ